MALDEIPQVYRADAAHLHTTPEQHIFMLLALPSMTEEEKGTAKENMTFTTLIIVIYKLLCISICIWGKKYRFKFSLITVCFPLYLISQWF